MDITIRQIKYFVATAEAGQVSRASKICNVTQSSITIAIRSLENSLGYELFDRQTNGMLLTVKGEKFLRHCHAIMRTIEDAIETQSESSSEVSGTVKLAVTDTISGYVLPPIWRRLKQQYPQVHLQVFEAQSKEIKSGLLERKYDLAMMTTSNVQFVKECQFEHLFTSPRKLWISHRHQLADQDEISIHDLKDEDYILLTMDEHETVMKRVWDMYDFTPQILFRSHSVEALRSMVANDMGVAILSDMVYRSWSLEGRPIIRKELKEIIAPMDVSMMWLHGATFSLAISTFIDFLKFEVSTTLNKSFG